MRKPLRVLFVDDSEDDVELLVRELRKGGFEVTCERVETRPALEAALARGPWDVVLTDYSMPHFDGISAMAVARTQGHDGPVILISGTIGEDVAVEAMKAGADDYVMKTSLPRLVPAVERELREAENRVQRIQTGKALELSQERFRRLFEAAADSILLVDASGVVFEANAVSEKALGRPRTAVLGKNVGDLLPTGERVRRLIPEALADNEGAPIEISSPWRDGRWALIEVRVRNFALRGDPPFLAVILHDTTAEREARLHREEKERLVFATQLAAYVAHELNTPLANIALLTNSAKRSRTPEALAERLGRIDDQRRRATQIINEILRLGQGQMLRKEEIDLRALVEEASTQVELYRHPAVVFEARLGSEPALLIGDRAQLRQVFMNLLKNALQATSEGTVRVELEQAEDSLRVTISDTGSGMAADTLSRLFQPFFTTKELGKGTGLGLTFCKTAVTAHGGEIRVTSELGKGSKFTVVLPRRSAEARLTPTSD